MKGDNYLHLYQVAYSFGFICEVFFAESEIK